MGGVAMHATPPCGGIYQSGHGKSTGREPSSRSLRKDTGDVPHLAARTDRGLAVEMNGGSGNFEPAPKILDLAANEVGHFHPAVADRLGERPARYRPDMLLELRYRSSVESPMAGIVHPRSNFVDEQSPVAALHKHLDCQHAHIVEGLRDGLGDPARLLGGVGG